MAPPWCSSSRRRSRRRSRSVWRAAGPARSTPCPTTPTVRIATDGATYARLACGRGDPAAALAAGSVRVEGDEALGARIVDELNFLF